MQKSNIKMAYNGSAFAVNTSEFLGTLMMNIEIQNKICCNNLLFCKACDSWILLFIAVVKNSNIGNSVLWFTSVARITILTPE